MLRELEADGELDAPCFLIEEKVGPSLTAFLRRESVRHCRNVALDLSSHSSSPCTDEVTPLYVNWVYEKIGTKQILEIFVDCGLTKFFR